AASWAATNSGLVLDGNPALSMAVSATNPDTVYVGTAPRVTRTHIYRTTDGGASWTDVTGPLPDRHPLDIAIDPLDPAIVYVGYGGAGTGHVFRTTDAGGSWTDITGILPDIPVTALLVDPLNSAVVYLGSDIGVYISTNGGGSWEPFNDGLPEAVLVSDLTMTPSNRTLRAATHGNSVFERMIPASLPSLSGIVPSGGEVWDVGSQRAISWTQTLLSTVKIEYSIDDGSSWIPIVASAPAWPDSFIWNVPPVLTTLGRVRVTSNEDSILSAQSAGPFTIKYDGIILELAQDWNLASVPVKVPVPTRSAIFPSSVGKAYRYDGAYVSAETLETGPGYWIKVPAAEFLPVGGDSVAADTVPVLKGWNIVGSLSVPVQVTSLVTEPPGLLETPFYAYDGSYTESDTLLPGRGYWAKMIEAGSLILDAAAPVSARQAIPPRSTDDGSGVLRLTDALGRAATLRVSQHPASRTATVELPPIPPPGGFDVRFPGGSFLSVIDDAVHPLRWQGVRFPAVISWDLPGGESYLLSTGDGTPVGMKGTGYAEITSPAALNLRRVAEGAPSLPGTFSLDQNYPNPFNPVTRIRFVLAGDGSTDADPVPVSLGVYDIGGRLAGALIEEAMAPGVHTLDWNAGELPGGVYFCVLRSGGSTRMVKMLLMR
ncbi:MAG TPA: hypothetical protein VI932_06350, partial [Bacteroidota bacterium]|nr:hypothetical protein [Bacteroidota bacterium]